MKVIATDLDRTLIPNGQHTLSKGAMELFKRQLKKNKLKLVYVTGRNRRLLEEGVKKYKLPFPDYCIAYTGAVIYKHSGKKFVELKKWQKVISKDWKGLKRKDIAELLKDVKGIRQQELTKLTDYKQSYYVPLNLDRKKIVSAVKKRLAKKKINAAVIFSVDVNRKMGLLDVMPKSGIKGEALKYVMRLMRVGNCDVLYCGDSANDFSPFLAACKGVLVKNAAEEVKRELKRELREEHRTGKIYFAKGDFKGLNGNYVSGIIEGAYLFGFFRDK